MFVVSGADDRNKFGTPRVDESALPDYPRGLKAGQVFFDNADTGRPSLNIPVKLGADAPTLTPAIVLVPEPASRALSLLKTALLASSVWFAWKQFSKHKKR